MKTTLHRIILLLFLAVVCSCKKNLLDTVPTDRLSTEVFWKTTNDANLAVTAIYPKLDGPVRLFFKDALTDIGHINEFYSPPALVEQNLYDASSASVSDEWTNDYGGIAASNFVLDNIGKIPIDDTNTSLISQYRAEAKALRAYQYIKLAAIYGDIPLVIKSLTISDSKQLVRTPVALVWDFIDKELTEAAEALPVTYPSASIGRVTKGAALALNMRANLYAGRFQKAADMAKKVMDLNVYSIYPQYGKLFSYAAENNAEVILDRQYVKDVLPINVFALMAPYSVNGTNSPVPNSYVPTKALADMYTMKNGLPVTDPASGFNPNSPYSNRDPRMGFSLFVPGDILPNSKIFNPLPDSGTQDAIGGTFYATSTGYTVKKYINNEDLSSKTNNGINIILLRYAEVLLSYAEARIEMNQVDATVIDAINRVRQRSDVNLPAVNITMTVPELRNLVRKERTIELAFEGHRFFDVKRWRIAENVIPGKVYGITYAAGGILKTIEVPSFQKAFNPAKDYLWPVPQNEIILNRQLTQNPGW